MADNVFSEAVVTSGTKWKTDEDTSDSTQVPYSKLMFGADGTFTIASATNPYPVALYLGTVAITSGAGTVGTGVARVTLASDDPAVTALQLIDDAIVADDAAFTPATTKVLMAGFEFDGVSPDSVNEGDAGAARMSANRCQYVVLRDNSGNERGLDIDANGKLSVAAVAVVTEVTAISGALPTGSNQIGKLAANSGVDIGDVDVTSVIAGTGATNLGKAVDAIAGATDTGVAALVVRDDALTTLAPADGDYAPLRVNSTGELWVTLSGLNVYTTDAVAPASPTGIVALVQRDDALVTLTPGDGDWAGPLRVNARGALWTREESVQTDDAAFTPGTGYVLPVAFLADESASDSVDEGDAGIARMTLDRKVHTATELESSFVRVSGTQTTIKRLVLGFNASGENTMVAAVAAKKIRVHAIDLTAAAAVNLYFNNATDGARWANATQSIDLVTPFRYQLPFNQAGWFETGTVNEALRCNLSAAVDVGGGIVYTEV